MDGPQALAAGVIDELTIDIVPIWIGASERIFEGEVVLRLEPVRVIHSPPFASIPPSRRGISEFEDNRDKSNGKRLTEKWMLAQRSSPGWRGQRRRSGMEDRPGNARSQEHGCTALFTSRGVS